MGRLDLVLTIVIFSIVVSGLENPAVTTTTDLSSEIADWLPIAENGSSEKSESNVSIDTESSIEDFLSDKKKSSTENSHVTKIRAKLKPRTSEIQAYNKTDLWKILESFNAKNALTASIIYNKEREENVDFSQFSFINMSHLEERLKLADNYGISAVLSSNIFSLKSVIDGMEETKCKNHSLKMMRALLSGEKWALKMYDSSAKSAVGLLWGSTFQLGNFDECLSVYKEDSEENDHIEGQYCLANIQYTKKEIKSTNVKKRLGPRHDIHWAICIPASCSSSQIQEFVLTLLLRSASDAKVTVPANYCHKNTKSKIDDNDIGFMTFVLGFTAVLFGCTIYHGYIHIKLQNNRIKETTIKSAILSFSIARNLNKIFTVKQQNDLGLDAIAGLKSLSMILIVGAHTVLFTMGGPVLNTGAYDQILTKVENALMISNPLLVDTFLFISAFLFSRILLAELDKRNGKVNIIAIYIFRYIRLTASYIIVIAFYVTLLDKIGEGPLWDSRMQLEKERCQKSWWANLLYINNYVQTENLCMFQSWYLSVDTQLFFLAPLIIYPLWRWRRAGECLLIISTVVTTAIPFAITYINDLDPTLMPFTKEITDISKNYYFKEAYIKTHMRASTYCGGLCFGYILYKIQNCGYKFSRKMLTVGWILCGVSILSTIFTVTIFFQPDYIYNSLDAALYSSLHHVGWSIGNGWMLIMCATKNGGLIEKMFSWKPFIPLARLTYCAYLVNGIIELNMLGTLRNSIYVSVFNLAVVAFSHIVQTFLAALILCVMFESPIHRIEKILLNTIGRSNRNKNTHKLSNESIK